MLLREWESWRVSLTKRLRSGGATADNVATTIARTIAERPLFCDLMSEMSAVLERNVSVATVQAFKSQSLDKVDDLGAGSRRTDARPRRPGRTRDDRSRARHHGRAVANREPGTTRDGDVRRGPRTHPDAPRLRRPAPAPAQRPDHGLPQHSDTQAARTAMPPPRPTPAKVLRHEDEHRDEISTVEHVEPDIPGA